MELPHSIHLWGPILQLLCPKASRDLLRVEESEMTPLSKVHLEWGL